MFNSVNESSTPPYKIAGEITSVHHFPMVFQHSHDNGSSPAALRLLPRSTGLRLWGSFGHGLGVKFFGQLRQMGAEAPKIEFTRVRNL